MMMLLLYSKVFVLNRSAVSGRVKRTMLAQEGIRRLRNTRPDLVEGLKVELMEDFSEMMMISGYPEHYRASVLQAVLTGYRRQVEAAQRGEKPLYRPRQWKEEERKEPERSSLVSTSRYCTLLTSYSRLRVG